MWPISVRKARIRCRVLAAVACGLFLGRRSVTYFSSAVRLEAWAFWSALTFILNGIVFLVIGLQLPGIYSRIENRACPG